MLQGKVIDADGHVLEPPDLWREYLESKYRDRAIRMEKDGQGFEHLVIDGRPLVVSRGIGPLGAGIGQPFQEIFQPGAFGYLNGPQGAYDAHARLKLPCRRTRSRSNSLCAPRPIAPNGSFA